MKRTRVSPPPTAMAPAGAPVTRKRNEVREVREVREGREVHEVREIREIREVREVREEPLTHVEAAGIIQKAWRRHIVSEMKSFYKYYSQKRSVS